MFRFFLLPSVANKYILIKYIFIIYIFILFMNVSFKQLNAFITVAECKSFVDACRILHITQPALSIAIKNLEQAVGGKLLVRTTRTLTLSPEGQTFLPVAKRLVADWETAFNDLHNLFAKHRGKLSIAAMPSYAASLLPGVLAQFYRDYPNMNVLIDDVIAELVNERVRTGRAEIGITFKPEEMGDFVFSPLFTDEFVVAIPKNHELAGAVTLQWQDLADYPLLLLQRPSSVRHLIDRTLKENGIEVNVEMEAHQLYTLGQMVSLGLGLSVVPTLCVEQMEALGAVFRPLKNPVISREVGVLTRRDYPLSAAAEAMVGILARQ